jgi:hypothetical protein
MTTTEHLQLIKTECERLLALSEKRTQGEWNVYDHKAYHTSYILRGGEKQNQLAQFFNYQDKGFDISSENNAAYIAACAGRAEAGWRSTIAAIDLILDYARMIQPLEYGEAINYSMRQIRAEILDAWPIKLLQQ